MNWNFNAGAFATNECFFCVLILHVIDISFFLHIVINLKTILCERESQSYMDKSFDVSV